MHAQKRMKVAIIDNSIDTDVYTPVDHWSQHLDANWEAFRAKKGDFPDLDNFSHLILSGSEASILEREDWVEREIDLIQESIRKGIPTLGSCYGHQLLALALKGPDYVRNCPEPEVGWIAVQITQENELLGKQGEFHVYTSHFDEVVDLGEDFKILASSERCRIHVFQFKDGPFWGIQAHPEMDISASRQFMQNRVAQESESSRLYQEALNSQPRDSGFIERIVQCFMQRGKDKIFPGI